MTSNQTPKYSIGQEVYCIVENRLWKGTVEFYRDTEQYYAIHIPNLSIYPASFIREEEIYATKEDIIKDLP